MKKILVLFHMGSEVRQFGHSGFIDALIEKGWQVLIGSHLPADEWRSEINPAVTFISIPRPKPNFVYEQIVAGLDLAQTQRRQKAGLSNWSYGKKTPPKNFKQGLQRSFQAFLGSWFTNPILSQWGRLLEMRLIRLQGEGDFARFLDEHKPAAIVVNVPRFGKQTFLLSAAEQRGIPRFLFYHTNKDVVALSRLNHRFTVIGVWNEWMKEQLLAQNSGFDVARVHITGCSHFDCVGRADWLIPPEEFRSSIGAEPAEQLILYTAAGPGLVPAEERFIEVVVQALKNLSGPKIRLVVRLNPMDTSTCIADYLAQTHPQVITLRPDWYYLPQHNLCYQRKRDAVFFNNLLQNIAVCVNIPSTLTIECALVGVPVINLGFDLPGPALTPGSIKAFWDVDYYHNVRLSGAALLAQRPADLVKLLGDCLANRSLLQSEQQRLVDLELNGSPRAEAHNHYVRVIQTYLNVN